MPIEHPLRPPAKGPGAGLFAALALTAVLQVVIGLRSGIIAKDGMGFIRIADELRRDPIGTLRIEDQHPGYPAMVLAGSGLAGRLPGIDEFNAPILGARLASGFAGLAVVLLVWLLARRLFDRRVADVAALLAAAWPLMRQNAADVLSDTPHLMFYLAAAWLACEGFARGRIRWFVATGIASGLAYWVRPEGLLVGLTAGLVLLIQLCRSPRQDRFRVAMSGLALGLALAATAAPYVVLAGKLTSKKNPFNRTPPPLVVAAQTVEPTAGLLSEPLPGRKLPGEITRPASLIGACAAAVAELAAELAQGFYYLLLIPLAAWALAAGRLSRLAPCRTDFQSVAGIHVAPTLRDGDKMAAANQTSATECRSYRRTDQKSVLLRPEAGPGRMISMLLACHAVLLVLLFLTAAYVSHRHVMPMVALLLPATAAGTIWLAEQAAARVARLQSPQRALAAIVAAILIGLLPKAVKPLHGVYSPIVEAARWVKNHGTSGDAVLATSGYVRFYSGMCGLLVGPEAPNLPIGLALAPGARPWPFIVLEVDERTFDRQQLCGPAGEYEQVLEIAAHPRKSWAKVLVFSHRAADDARVAARNESGSGRSN